MNIHGSGSHHAALLTVASAFFLEVLDATIMIVAIIPLADDLGASISGVTLALAAYLLALVVFTPASGHLFKTLGLAQRFQCGLLILCLASLACASSQNLYMLCIARLAQGFGSALIVPAGRTLILANTDKNQIPRIMAWLIAPALVAPIVAPSIANVLLSLGNWRLIFGFIAFCAAGLIAICRATLFALPAPAARQHPLDVYAYGLWALSSSALFTMFVAGSNSRPLYTLLAAIVMLYAGVRLYQRLCQATDKQLFDLTLLNNPLFKFNIVSGSFFRISIYAFPTVLIIHLLKTSDYPPSSIGHCLLFIFAGNLLAKPVAARILANSHSIKRYFLYSALATSITLSVFFYPRLSDPLPVLWLACALHGCARSFQFLGYSSSSLRDIQPSRMHHANILLGAVMQHNALIAQAVPALLAAFLIPSRLPGESSDGFFNLGMATVTVLSLMAVVSALRMPNSSRQGSPPSTASPTNVKAGNHTHSSVVTQGAEDESREAENHR